MGLLRARGYYPRIAESYNAYIQRSRDLCGFIDICALHTKEVGVLGVQTTTSSNLRARVKKAESLEA